MKRFLNTSILLCRSVVLGGMVCGMVPLRAMELVGRSWEVESLHDALDIFAQTTSESLVVLDLDGTIAQPRDPIFRLVFTQGAASTTEKNKAIFELYADFRQKKSEEFFVRALLTALKHQLVEMVMSDIIHDLQQRKVPVLVLSAFEAKQSDIPEGSTHESRYQLLKGLGIDLSTSFDFQERVLCEDVSDWYGTSIRYYKGIISTANRPKGVVLWDFMRLLREKKGLPHNIVFVDDVRENIVSVQKEMNWRGVANTVLWYTRALSQVDAKVLDVDVVKKQFDFILAHDSYISYEDASRLGNSSEDSST